MKKITLNHITKIEGHAKLNLEIEKGKVKTCELSIFEGSRFFEGILKTQDYSELPDITSRICGICSIFHTIASIKTVESAFNIKTSEQTELLRELLLIGGMIQSHVLHLYFLVLPDYKGCKNALELATKDKSLIRRALEIKKVSNLIVNTIGAREIHPISAIIGGFTRLPEEKDLKKILKELKKCKREAEQTVKIFQNLKYPEFEFKSDTFALTDGSYFCSDKIISCDGKACIPTNDYEKHFKEYFKEGSTAEFAKTDKSSYRVGALARLMLNKHLLSEKSKSFVTQIKTPNNPFMNNVAQAIEIYEGFEQAINILENLKIKKEELPKVEIKATTGVSALEAPRGILFHKYKFDKKGKCTFANITTPTTQNLQNIEDGIRLYVPELLKQELNEEQIKLEIEKLIRAYDPCISCSTHFLEFNFKNT